MAKGDAVRLKADTDDGFARVSNLLLEAFACAPLSGAQLRVVMFVMRRTYGWCRSGRRAVGKMDTITAQEVARGTGMPRRTAEDAIAELTRAHVLLSEIATLDNRRRYGINPDVGQWGLATPEWSMVKPNLRDARDTCTYKPVDLYGEIRTPVRGNPESCTGNPVHSGGRKPRASGPPRVPTDSITDIYTENGSKDLVQVGENDAAACTASPDPVEQKRQQRAAKDKRDAERFRQQTEQLDAALAALSQLDRELLDTMLAGQQLAKDKPLTLLQQKTQADIYARELAQHGPECWRACCQVACEKGIYTAEYARGCTKNWVRPGGNGNGHGRLPPQQLTELDRMQLQADYEREEAARRGDQRIEAAVNPGATL